MKGAGTALQEAAVAALRQVAGLNRVYDAPPLQAAAPYGLVEVGPEGDWSHKSGTGRELRLALTLHDKGEGTTRLRELMAQAEASIAGIDSDLDGWRLVNLSFLRSRVLSRGVGDHAGVIEYRTRLLAE